MKIKYLLLFLVPVLLFSCTSEKIGNDAEGNSGNTNIPDFQANLSKDAIIPGAIRIKLDETTYEELSLQTKGGEVVTGISDMDELASELGATKIEPTFGKAGRCEPRWHKAGLDRWFDVYFDKNVPVTRAYNDFTNIRGISVVEPCLKINREPYEASESYTAHELLRLANSKTKSAADSASGFDDPGLGKQWHYYNDGSMPCAKAGADIDLVKAWKICTGNPEVIVDVVDDGIDISHEDLAANIWHNTAEISCPNMTSSAMICNCSSPKKSTDFQST
jgi:subtilisin family serine protease